MDKFLKFFQLVKVDEATRTVYGLVTAEAEDKDGEICHYDSTKPEYKAVNDELGKATDGQNIMPLREMHQLHAIGAGKSIDFDDARKQIRMGFKVVDDNAWKKVTERVLLGFSQGGKYIKRWTENGKKYYTAQPGEVSLVDNPCLPGAYIEYSKADGNVEMFKTPENKLTDADVERITKALKDQLEKGVKYLAPGGHLPYTDESGKPSHSHMGAAWAALHGGYRGNKYEGPGKQHAIARLKELYHSEGMTPPSEKAAALITELSKTVENEFLWDTVFAGDGSDLDTRLEEFSALVAKLMAQKTATGATDMKPEDIKKCAAALGISEADFIKQFIDGGVLLKAKHGIAALHSHMETAMAHHDGMMKAHKDMMKAHEAMASMHEKHSGHLDKCMKACKSVMGDDEKDAEKAIKALVDELKGAAAPSKEGIVTTNTELAQLIAAEVSKGIKAEMDKLPAPQKAHAMPIARFSEEELQKTRLSDETPVNPYGN